MSEQEQGIDFGYLIRWLLAHWVALLIAGVLGVAVAIVMGLRAPEVFRAEVVIIEASQGGLGRGSLMNQLGGIAGLAGINIGGSESSHHDRALLRSRHLAEEFIARYKLLPILLPDVAENQGNRMWTAVRRFKSQTLGIREDSRTELITISMNAGSPERAAQWANNYAALANELARVKAITEASRNIAYLRTEIAKTEVAELQRVLYQLVENESKTLMLANARPDYAFSVVDPAVAPAMRDSPRRAVMALFGLTLGVLLGVVFVIGRSMIAGLKQPVVR